MGGESLRPKRFTKFGAIVIGVLLFFGLIGANQPYPTPEEVVEEAIWILGRDIPELHLLVIKYPIEISTKHQYAGWSFAGDETIYVNPTYVRENNAWGWIDSAYLACTLTHEAAHKYFEVGEEMLPELVRYYCMNELHASQYLRNFVRDNVYQELLEEMKK